MSISAQQIRVEVFLNKRAGSETNAVSSWVPLGGFLVANHPLERMNAQRDISVTKFVLSRGRQIDKLFYMFV